MASQVQGWSVATSKQNKKKDKEKGVQEAIKQQYADYLHTKNGGLDDLTNFEDEEYVPETPDESSNEPLANENAGEESSSNLESGIKELPAYAAWLRRATEFERDPRYLKEDLALVKYDILTKDRLILDEPDITPVTRSWGACLLGRFTGRFPGKEAIFDLTRRWPCKSRVTFHRKGWLCFQFGSEEDREAVRQKGPFEIFGIPLVLQPMPDKFNPNMEPEVNIPLWLRLVDLPMELWNLTAVSKIASCIGTPLSTDFGTLRRESLDGPRVQVIVNTAVRPKTGINIQLPSGHYEQKIEFEFFPKFCNACKVYGHFADECRERQTEYERYGTNPRTKSRERLRSNSRPHRHQGAVPPFQGWAKGVPQPGTHMRNGDLVRRAGPLDRSRSRSRSKQQQHWKPTGIIYPIHITGTRKRREGDPPNPGGNQQGILDIPKSPRREGDPQNAGGNEEGIPDIPKSPNRFDMLATEDNLDPKGITVASKETHIEIVKDILAAAIPPILAGLQGNASLQQQAPFVSVERRYRSNSRDPRIPRDEGKSDDVTEVITTDEPGALGKSKGVDVEEGAPEKEDGSGARTGGKKKKNKKHANDGSLIDVAPGPDALPDAIVTVNEPGTPQHNKGVVSKEQDKEASGRLSRAERTGDSTKRKKSKSRSKSRGRKNEEIPSHWEDGLEDDPGNAQ